MATRSHVGYLREDGKVVVVYVHNDGSPDTRMPLLTKHWTDRSKLIDAIDHGDCSVWGKSAYPSKDGHSFDNPERDVNVYYGRDRGQADVGPWVYGSVSDVVGLDEFTYIMDLDGNWTCEEE